MWPRVGADAPCRSRRAECGRSPGQHPPPPPDTAPRPTGNGRIESASDDRDRSRLDGRFAAAAAHPRAADVLPRQARDRPRGRLHRPQDRRGRDPGAGGRVRVRQVGHLAVHHAPAREHGEHRDRRDRLVREGPCPPPRSADAPAAGARDRDDLPGAGHVAEPGVPGRRPGGRGAARPSGHEPPGGDSAHRRAVPGRSAYRSRNAVSTAIRTRCRAARSSAS